MAEVGTAYVTILPSTRGFGRALNRDVNAPAAQAGAGIGKTFGKAFAIAGAAIIGAKIGGFFKGSAESASQLQQSIGGVQAVFGEYAKAVQRDSKLAAQALGLSANEYNELVTVSGALLKNNGIKNFAKESKNLLTIGADLSATFGGSTSQAVEALNAAMRGESDPIERYGISLNETAVNAELAARGQNKLKGAALQQAKAQARLRLISKQSADAQGRFADESNTLAGQQQRLGAQWENFKATLGGSLLPALTSVFGFLNKDALPAIKGLGKAFAGLNFGNIFESLSGGAGPASERLKQFNETVETVFAALKSTFASTISIATSLWNTFGATLISAASRALQSVMNIIQGAFNVIAGIFRTVAAVLRGDWSEAWEGVKQIARGALQLLLGILQGGLNTVKTVFSLAGDALGALMRAAWDGIKAGTVAGIAALVGLIKALPGRLVGLLGNLNTLLFDAGVSLIQGLIDGIGSMFDKVKGKLGDLTGSLTSWKGPPSTDRVLLKPNGRLLMEGLISGISSGVPDVERTLRGVTANIPRMAIDSTVGAQAGPSDMAGGHSGPMFQVEQVVAQDVNDFLRQMQARQQLASLDGIQR